MFRSLVRHFALLALPVSIAGCSGGGSGSGGDEGVILDVQPRYAVRGRQVGQTIALRGDGTRWASDGLGVDDISFGADVAITRLAVANDRYIEVDVQVLPNAVIGYRDILVGNLPFSGIFRVSDPFRVVGGTPIKPGRFFRAIVEGTETQWIDGVEVSSTDEQVILEGGYLPLGGEALFTDVISEHYLEITGYTHWYAFNGTGGDIDLLIGLGPEEERDLGVGTLEIEAEPRKVMPPKAAVQGQIEEEFGTHVYEYVLPEFSYCGINVYGTSVASEMTYELYRPTNPGTPWWDESTFSTPYTASPYTFAAETTYVVVHDQQMRGGEGFGYVLESDCDLLAPLPLVAGAPRTGEIGSGDNASYDYFQASPPRWALSTWTLTPDFAILDHSIYLYREGPFDSGPDFLSGNTAAPGGIETIRATNGTRPRALLEVYAGGYAGPDSAYSVVRTEVPMPGGTIYENLSPLDIPDTGVSADSTISVTGAGAIASAMYVALDIAHPYSSDLVLELISPQGISLHLTDRDYAGVDLITIFPELTPTTTGLLSALASSGDPNGTWILRMTDDATSDVGQLKGWALTFE